MSIGFNINSFNKSHSYLVDQKDTSMLPLATFPLFTFPAIFSQKHEKSESKNCGLKDKITYNKKSCKLPLCIGESIPIEMKNSSAEVPQKNLYRSPAPLFTSPRSQGFGLESTSLSVHNARSTDASKIQLKSPDFETKLQKKQVTSLLQQNSLMPLKPSNKYLPSLTLNSLKKNNGQTIFIPPLRIHPDLLGLNEHPISQTSVADGILKHPFRHPDA